MLQTSLIKLEATFILQEHETNELVSDLISHTIGCMPKVLLKKKMFSKELTLDCISHSSRVLPISRSSGVLPMSLHVVLSLL